MAVVRRNAVIDAMVEEAKEVAAAHAVALAERDAIIADREATIKQREELPHMGRAARKLIQSYSVSAVADSIEAAARELAASKGMKWP